MILALLTHSFMFVILYIKKCQAYHSPTGLSEWPGGYRL